MMFLYRPTGFTRRKLIPTFRRTKFLVPISSYKHYAAPFTWMVFSFSALLIPLFFSTYSRLFARFYGAVRTFIRDRNFRRLI